MPHKPKGPVGSFFLYYHSNKERIMKDNKNQLGSELVKIASK
jgi:hypothetical protein